MDISEGIHPSHPSVLVTCLFVFLSLCTQANLEKRGCIDLLYLSSEEVGHQYSQLQRQGFTSEEVMPQNLRPEDKFVFFWVIEPALRAVTGKKIVRDRKFSIMIAGAFQPSLQWPYTVGVENRFPHFQVHLSIYIRRSNEISSKCTKSRSRGDTIVSKTRSWKELSSEYGKPISDQNRQPRTASA